MIKTTGSEFPIPAAHSTFRSIPVCLTFNAIGIVFMSALFIPVVGETLGIRPAQGVISTTALLAAVNLAALAYRVRGLSPLYRWLDLVEGVTTAAFHGVVVFKSGGAENFVWLFYVAHTVMAATMGTTWPNICIIGGGPMVLGLAFALQHDVASATLSSLGGALGLTLYLVVARTHDALEVSRRREAL